MIYMKIIPSSSADQTVSQISVFSSFLSGNFTYSIASGQSVISSKTIKQKEASIIRKYHNHILQTNPLHP